MKLRIVNGGVLCWRHLAILVTALGFAVTLGAGPGGKSLDRSPGPHEGDDAPTHHETILPGEAKTISYAGAELAFPAGSVATPTTIGIRVLEAGDLAPMNPSMTNVTQGPGSGYRFTPHGSTFARRVLVSLPYDPALLVAGETADDIHTYFFDAAAGSWKALERVKVDSEQHLVNSYTDHFTDMVNGTVSVPDHPTPVSFNPTSLKDLKAADPGAGINLIEPPQPNGSGSTNLRYPIEVPPGRSGMQPDITVQYNSGGDNGWMGLGWELPMQAIMIDTRWGVPRYDAGLETETYLLNGEQLTPVAHRGVLQPRTAEKEYHTRVEGMFRKIIRHGDNPTNYWWEVIDKNGTRSFYGGDPVLNAPAADSTLTDPEPGSEQNVYEWALREMRDTNGNFIKYNCVRVNNTGLPGGSVDGVQLYLDEIQYTGFGADEGPHSLRFIRQQGRTDVMIDCRGGFKMVTADLLTGIEVKFGSELIRTYEFQYETGAFEKTRLLSISQLGQDGTLFNRHEFEYFDELRDAGGAYNGFTAPAAWSPGSDDVSIDLLAGEGQASALGGSAAVSGGGHLFIGFNPTSPSKKWSFGAKTGFSLSETEGSLALVDVTGDELPDKVFKDGDHLFYRPNLSGPDGGTTFGDRREFRGVSVSDFFEETSDTATVGTEAYPTPASVMADASFTFTTTSIYFSDVNGDGLSDLVDNGAVLFTFLDADGVPNFTADSNLTPVPIDPGAVDSAGLLDDFTDIFEERVDNYPLLDSLRRWIAPFDGQIGITGEVRLKDTSAEQASENYLTADGVRLAIQHNDDELWTIQIAHDDHGLHAPEDVDMIDVARGDHIYFRVQSIFDGAFDEVEWTPAIDYVGAPNFTDVDALNPYHYAVDEDFVLAGRGSPVQVPFNGTTHLAGNLAKTGVTTDDVTLVVRRNDTDIITRSLAWDQVGQIVLDDDVAVVGPGECESNVCQGGARDAEACDNTGECPADVIQFLVRIDSPVDLSLLEWIPELFYVDSPDVDHVFDSNGDPLIRINPPYDIDLYPDDELAAPQLPWTVPATGNVFVLPVLDLDAAFGPFDSELVLTVKRRNELVAKRVIPIVAGVLPPLADLVFVLSVTEDDELFFDYSSRDARDLIDPTTDPPTYDPALTDKLTFKQVFVISAALPLPFEVPSAFHNADLPDAFNEPYRGWAVVAYNGNRERATQPIDQSVFVDFLAKIAGDEQYDFDSSLAYPLLPLPAEQRWRAQDEFCFVARAGMSSSRMGVDSISVPGSAGFARAVPRLSTAEQLALGGGFGGVVSGSITPDATSRGELDFFDMNGDRFPDVLGKDRVQFTTLTGGLEGANRTVSGLDPLRTNNNLAANGGLGFGVGGNPAKNKPDAKGNVEPTGSRSTATGQQGSEMPELGFSGQLGVGESSTAHDLMDLNGDGLPDRVFEDGNGQLFVAFNLGYGFAPQEPWQAGKINDGTSTSFDLGLSISFNDGIYGFGGGASLSRSESTTGRTLTDDTGTLLDINGDGLLDFVTPGGAELTVSFNTGARFASPVAWRGGLGGTIADSATATEGGGAYFTITIGPLCPPPFGTGCFIIINPGGNLNHSMSRPKTALRDLDGDGYADQISSASDDQMTVATNLTGRTNLLRRVRRPLGATITLDYARDGNTSDLPQSRWNLSRVEVFDGLCGDGIDTMVSTYQYQQGRYNRNEREFYGYGTVIEEQRDSSNGDSLFRTNTTTYLNDNFYNKSLMSVELVQDAAGDKFTEEINTFSLVDISTGTQVVDPNSTTATVFPQLVRTDNLFYEGQAAAGKSTFTTLNYDLFGNISEQFEAGDVGAADDLTSTIGYFTDLAAYIVGIPDQIVVTGNGEELRRREATIEAGTGDLRQVRRFLETGEVAITDLDYFPNGNLQRVTGPPNLHGERFVVEFEYDTPTATHITSIVDSFGYQSTASHNLHFGAQDVTTDINGNQTDYDYDVFGRIAAITGSYETGGAIPTLRFEYHPDQSAVVCPNQVGVMPYALTRHIDVFRDINDPIDTVLFTDGLKRILQTKKDGTIHTGPDTPAQDVTIVSGRVTFDHVGRTIEQYHPITEPLGTPGVFNAGYDSVVPTRTEYDVLDRTTLVTIPDNTSTSTAYGFGPDRDGVLQFETIMTDANGIEKRTYKDVRELVTAIREVNNGGAEIIWTSYSYDPMKQLVQVTDDHSNATHVIYDNFGRMIAMDNPDTGLTDSQYDLADNMIAEVTANLRDAGLQISHDYEFNRRVSISYPLFSGNNVAFTYGDPGAPFNRAGRVALVTDESGSEERFYGKLGEIVKEIKTVASDTQGDSPNSPEVYTTQYTYDTWNRLQQLIYPDGEVCTYQYDSGGLSRAATGVKNGFTFPYLQRLEYDKFEQRVFMLTQNQVRTTYAYDPLDRRLALLTAGKIGGPLFQNLHYTYDDVGNVLQTHNQVPVPPPNKFGGPVLQNYTYDDMYRLTSASGTHQYAPNKTSQYSLSMTYDSIYNITYKSQAHQLIQPSGQAIPQQQTTYTSSYAYDGPQPHAPTHIGARTYSYDANGNQIGWEHDQNGTDRTIVWDEKNRTQSIFDNGHEKTYKYDDSGERVIKRGPQGETAYVNPYFTVRNGTVATKHIYAGTTRVASKLSPGFTNPQPPNGTPESNFLYFYHPDHLGSSSYVTAVNGNLFEHLQYFPFGETWVQEKSNTQQTPYLYTAKELDEETKLYYYGARYSDPAQSQWLSPDPALGADRENMSQALTDSPATLSMYSYAQANPLFFKDPDGRDAEIFIQGTNITVKSSIYIWGPGATAARAKEIQSGISGAWARGGLGYKYDDPVSNTIHTLHVRVSVELFDEAFARAVKSGDFSKFENANIIKIIDEPVPLSEGTGGRSFVNEVGGSSGIWTTHDKSRPLGDIAAHEFVHLTGMNDRYNYETGVPDPGWAGNIAAQRGGIVEQKNIDAIGAYALKKVRITINRKNTID